MNPKRREPAGVRGSTAASGGNREKPAPQRSERGKAAKPPQVGFRAPQGGLRSRFKSLLLRQNSRSDFFERLLFLAKESIKRWDLNPKRREPAGVLKVKSEE